MSDFDQSIADRLEAHHQEVAKRIADDLRGLADYVERSTHGTQPRGREHAHTDVAGWTIQKILNALPNLNVARLTETAADLDHYLAKDPDRG